MNFFTDARLLFVRHARASLRNPIWMFISLFQPIVYLLLFAPLLEGLANVPGFPPGGALTVFTPGLLIMVAIYSTAYVGFGMVDQIRMGFIERLMVTPTNRGAILLGAVMRDVLTLIVQSAILVGIALLMGLTVSLGGILVTFALMVVTGALMAACSYALALRFKSEDTLASILNTIATPIMLLSGITLPLSLAPRIIRSIASVNPFYYEVTAARSLFLGDFSDPAIVVSSLFLGGLTVLSFWWAARSFRKAAA